MRFPFLNHFRRMSLARDERGMVLALALMVMVLMMGVSSTATYSGYTNLLTSTNLRLATQARDTAEAGINEAIYRLSRQEGQPGAIAPNLVDPFWNNPDWQVEIDFAANDSNYSDGVVGTIQPSGDWPEERPSQPVIIRYKKPDPTKPKEVLFYDRTQNPPFRTITLPVANPAVNIPYTAHPVIQITATGLDERGAERQILAEVASTFLIAPPAPLSSGVDVNLGGASFIDGVDHHHQIFLTPGNGTSTKYGNDNNETTFIDAPNQFKDSPDDNRDLNDCPQNGHPIANPELSQAPLSSCPRIYNRFISEPVATPPFPPSAWVGLTWIDNPAAFGCTAAPSNHPATPHWHGVNEGFASAVALSSTPVLLGAPVIPGTPVQNQGVYSWRMNNNISPLNSPPGTSCSGAATLVCRPPELNPFPTFQQYLGLDDTSFQKMLDQADTLGSELDSDTPPSGFTYVEGDFVLNSRIESPGTNDFVLLYVTGNLRIEGESVFKGLIFVDGSLEVAGTPTVLGAIMVHGSTRTTGLGNMTLLYSREAARRALQAAHPWRILSWTDTEMQ